MYIILERSTVLAHVDGDRGPHDERQVHVVMTARESAEHRDVVRSQHLAKHSFHALVGHVSSAIGKLTQHHTLATVEHAVQLQRFRRDPSKRYAVVFGNEVDGVRQDVVDAADLCVEIPQSGTKHSLNVSVSVGVVLWQLFYGH